MYRKLLLPVVSSVSVGIGFLTGTAYEKRGNSERNDTLKSFMSYLPFPVVNAATSLVKRSMSDPALSTNSNEIMKFGFPNFDNIRTYDDFILAYDRRNRTAFWVFEHMTADKLNAGKDTDRTKSQFVVSPFCL